MLLPATVQSSPRGTSASGPTASIAAAISASAGGTICDPSPRYTLYPLSCGGLCDAVTTTPATAPRCRIANATTGVGVGSSIRTASSPAPRTTAAVSRANTSDLCRASYPITTGPVVRPFAFRYAHRPAAARITTTRFIRFGPAPIAPRSPAVPNSSFAPNRSAVPASSPASSSARSSARVSGSGSSANQYSAAARSALSSLVTPATLPRRVWSEGCDVDEVFETVQILGVAGVQPCSVYVGGRSDQEIHGPWAWLSSRVDEGRGKPSVGARHSVVHRKRLERTLDAGQTPESEGALLGVLRDQDTEVQLGQAHGADGYVTTKRPDRRVDEHARIQDGLDLIRHDD